MIDQTAKDQTGGGSSVVGHIVMRLCARLPRGGFTVAKAARRLMPSLAQYPATLRFGSIELRGDVSQNIFYPLAVHGYYRHQAVEDDVLALLARDAGVIVDVGANIGYVAALMASFAPSARIIAFEPLALCRPYLEQVARRFPNIEVRPLAVGDAAGTAKFLQRQSIDRSSLAGKGEAPVTDTIEVEVTTLDEALRNLPVDLVKIDVEGFEPAVLRGARGVLTRDRPIVVYEAYEQEVSDFAVEFFRQIGDYSVYVINAAGRLRLLSGRRGAAPDTCNFVAWPASRPLPATLDIPRCYER